MTILNIMKYLQSPINAYTVDDRELKAI